MSYEIVDAVYLEIDGVPLSTPGWECLNPMDMRKGPATRGKDRVIPGAAGTRGKLRRPAPTKHQLQFVVVGDQSSDGTVNTDPVVGLDVNLQALRDLTDATGIGVPAKEAILHLPSGGTLSGDIHIELFDWQYEGPSAASATMDITILAGALA